MHPSIQDSDFWQADALATEFSRVADVCHGCRRCFNLCPSFSSLLNGIDAVDGEIQRLGQAVTDAVVDTCYYCKLCYNHCPYTPPHAFNLDFPLLMIRAKAVRARTTSVRLRDRLLVKTDFVGRLVRRVAPLVNRMNRTRWFRRLLHRWGGIHRDRILPTYAFHTFQAWFRSRTRPSIDGTKKVALFSGCLTNYNYPEIGRATVEVLEKNGVHVVWPEQRCCGMPFLDVGDFKALAAQARANLASLKTLVEQGYVIVSPIPSCSLTLKKEYPAILDSDDARMVGEHTYDVCEYLMFLHKRGELSTDFSHLMGNVVYQIPCHLRDQNIGYKSRDLMQLIPQTKVEVVERCTGHDGPWSAKVEFFDASMKVGEKAFRAVQEANAEIVVSDCPLSGLQIEQGTGRRTLHPIEVIHRAYGLPDGSK